MDVLFVYYCPMRGPCIILLCPNLSKCNHKFTHSRCISSLLIYHWYARLFDVEQEYVQYKVAGVNGREIRSEMSVR